VGKFVLDVQHIAAVIVVAGTGGGKERDGL
jgi:hypothetical protein